MVNVWDSIGKRISAHVCLQIAEIDRSSAECLTVRSVESQQQSGGDDCGLFSIATATSLCHGIPPSAVMWDERVMRSHLEACFMKGIITPFSGWDTPHPSIPSIGDEPVMSERVLVLHCVYRLSEDKKRRMAS